MATDYRKKAAAMVDPQFASKVASAKSAFDTSVQALEDSKLGINRNYDKRIENNTLQNNLTKNNVSNRALGTGMARSTIAMGDLASIDLKNTRETGDINEARTGDLNQVENQKSLLSTNYNNTLNALNADKEAGILSLAEQLRQRDEDTAFRNRQLAQQAAESAASRAFQREQFDAEQSWKQKSYDAEMAKLEQANQPDYYSDKAKNDMISTYDTVARQSAESGKKFLEDNRKDIIKYYGPDTFNTLQGMQKQYDYEEKKANIINSRGTIHKLWDSIWNVQY
jgi:hypothetical protein